MSETTYKVSGIHCQSCVANISESVQEVGGVAAVEVDLDKDEVTVRGDSFDDTAVRSAIVAAGYEAV